MKQIEIENQLREVVSRIVTEIEYAAKQGRLDVNLVSEDAWIPILKESYNCPHLQNLNKSKKNFPGIDLGDTQDRVSFQVTATADIGKVKDTLKQFKEKNYKNTFDELYIFIITKKQKSYSQSAIDTVFDDEIHFDVKKHIIDPGDVLEKITALRLPAQERLLNEFKVILGDIEASKNKDNENVPYTFATNMVSVDIPNDIYVAEVALDEADIIERAKEQLDFKKAKASTYTLIKLALAMAGETTNNWVYHNKRLFSFINMEETSPFAGIVDEGTVERLTVADLYDNQYTEYQNILKYLLKNTLKDALISRRVIWHRKENTFYFLPEKEGDEIRKEGWVGKKTARRTVYELKYQKKDPNKVAHHRHLSFDISFTVIDGKWHGILNPGWFYTYNLYTKSRYHDDLLSQQKRLEHNHSVRNIIRFIAYYLSQINETDSPYLHFNELVELDCLLPQYEESDLQDEEDEDDTEQAQVAEIEN